MTVDDHALGALIVLISLPDMGPARLRRLLAAYDGPAEARAAVVAGRVPDEVDVRRVSGRTELLGRWRQAAQRADPRQVVADHRAAGVDILHPSHPAWPAVFRTDPEPPALLFAQGDIRLLESVGVAIVGTRRCTAGGLSIAHELGRDLADAGVAVISGLALGIDGAAHRGALETPGPVVGVVATGHDVVYPPRHRSLWAEVADRGVLLSESPLGTVATRWRFPARNRIMAALAEIVVVVESAVTGGSMRTVESALDRDTEVMAVPGPVRAPTSAGPNQLLVDGCGLVRDARDVLVALGSRAPNPGELPFDAVGVDRAPPDPIADLISWPPVSLDRLVMATGMAVGEVAARVTRLEAAGVVERVADGFQRCVR